MFKRLISFIMRELKFVLHQPKELTPSQINLKRYLSTFIIKGPEVVTYHNEGLCTNIARSLNKAEYIEFLTCLDKLEAMGKIKWSTFPIDDKATGISSKAQFKQTHLIHKYSGTQLDLRKELARKVIALIDQEDNL